MSNEKGLFCSVVGDRARNDCTNGGASSKHDNFVAVGNMVMGCPFEPSDTAPAMFIYERNVCGTSFLIACPEELEDGNSLKGFMFGGNFLFSSDSRFPSDSPIKIFDRKEW